MSGTSTSGRRPSPTRCLELSGSPRGRNRKNEPTIVPVLSVTPSGLQRPGKRDFHILFTVPYQHESAGTWRSCGAGLLHQTLCRNTGA